LPGITPTSKPAVAPVASSFSGAEASGLEPLVRASGSRVTAEVLRHVLAEAGYQVLMGEETGDPSGRAWTELGAIDAYGHQHGWKLAHHIAGELRAVERRIETLLQAGWRQVVVVTDHGWLLLPGGLPKAELPEHLTVVRKGRCARLKDFAGTDQQTVPWHWDSNVRIAMEPGICCYEAGTEYAHGGLSPQECIVPAITVTRPGQSETPSVSIVNITWRGLRCTITLAGGMPGLQIDIRTKAGDATTSLVAAPRAVDATGSAAVLVDDDDRLGEAAIVVILQEDGSVSTQTSTIIGGE
jgi:hypothetical protein